MAECNSHGSGLVKPDISFIISCASNQLSDAEINTIRELFERKTNWENILKSAIYHKTIPLLHRTLKNHFASEIPDNVLKRLNFLQDRISLQNLVLSASLINVVSLLNDHQIDVLPLKGPLLAERLYGSCNMRSFGDLDILVRKKDIYKSLNVLLQNNFILLPEGIPRSTYDRFMRHAYHGRLLDQNGVIIELHWELTGFYVSEGISYESVEPYLVKTEFRGCNVLDLTDEMLFFYLCIHGIKHRYEKLDYICSIVELLKKTPDMNWALIFELSEKYKIKRGILLTLAMADKLFGMRGCRKPEGMPAGEPDLSGVAEKIIEWNFGTGAGGDIAHPLQKNTDYQLAIFDDKLELFTFLFRSKFIPHHDEWSRVKYPKFLFHFYFLNITCRVFSFSIINRLNILLRRIKKYTRF